MTITPTGSMLGSSLRDLTFIEKKIAEYYRLHLAQFPYYAILPLDRQTGTVNTYGEIDHESAVKVVQYRPAVAVNLMVRLDPPQKLLDKFSFDSPQEAIVTASQLMMRDLTIRPHTGDRFDFNTWRYEIKTVKEGGWFSNSKFAVEWVMSAGRVTNP